MAFAPGILFLNFSKNGNRFKGAWFVGVPGTSGKEFDIGEWIGIPAGEGILASGVSGV